MTPSIQRDRLRVSIVSGVVVKHDAISNVCRQQVDALEKYCRENGVRLDLRVYAMGSDVPDSRYVLTLSVADVVRDPHYLGSDLIVFHFGIYYPVFEAIRFAPRTARVVVDFHGVTPPQFVSGDSGTTLERSYRQMAALAEADTILVHSRFIGRDLEHYGLSAVVPVELLPLAVALPAAPTEAVRLSDDPTEVRLAYVGRFVPAKGVLDLVRAAGRVQAEGQRLRLDLMGSRRFSCPRYITEVEDAVRAEGLTGARFGFDLPGSEIAGVLARADAFVLPSYHEGFCVPVIEALSHGAFVICSDAGALPETAGGLGLTYPAGDVDALTDRLRTFLAARERDTVPTDAGELTPSDWRRAKARHLAGFSPDRFASRFCELVLTGLRPQLSEAEAWNSGARIELLNEVTGLRPQVLASRPSPALVKVLSGPPTRYRPGYGVGSSRAA